MGYVLIKCNIPINQGDSSTITVDLTHDSNGDYIIEGIVPDGLLVTFKTNLGNIDSPSYIIAGSVQSNLNSGLNPVLQLFQQQLITN